MDTQKKTALHAEHLRLGAKMVPFGGWEMPVQFSSIREEHVAVRTRAGLFDVSHMGEFWVEGPQALDLVQYLTSNDASRLGEGQIQYTGLLTEEGCFVDDLLVYRDGERRFLMVVNAANIDRDLAWILDHAGPFDAEVRNESDATSQIAVQGPKAVEILTSLFPASHFEDLKYYRFSRGDFEGQRILVSRTGYTGEDGFEVYLPDAPAPALWQALLEAGGPHGLVPVGLGARDTLRLEASMALYGNDIDATTSVLEADLAWILKLDKGEFMGREPLRRQKETGVTRKLVGFELLGKGIARHGHSCLVSGEEAGSVTSGTLAPFLEKSIGMAYLPAARTETGTEFEVDIRGRRVPARVIPKPFYKRPRT